MIRELLNERIAEQRQKEIDDAEKARKKAVAHAEAIANAEKSIEKMLKSAQIDSFKIPDETFPALIINHPSNHSKGDFKKSYELFLGYSIEEDDGEVNTAKATEIGILEIEMPYVFGNFDFSDLFKSESPVTSNGRNCSIFTFM